MRSLRTCCGEATDETQVHMNGTLHFHAGHTVVARFPTHGAHLVLDAHRAGLFKHERCVDAVACSERLLQTNKHDVQRAGFELDGVARLDFQAPP